MSARGGPSASKSTGQLVGFSLVALSGVLGTTLAAQLGLSPWLTALVALGITMPLAFVLLVVQNLFLKWAPASSDRIDRMLRRYRKRYLESLSEHVRHLEVLGVATQGEFTLKLGDVYVDVALVPKSAADSRPARSRRQNLTQAIENSETGVVAVIGGPGSGKTTILRHQVLSLSDKKRGRLPILLEIRQHTSAIIADPQLSLAELAASSRIPHEWLKARLNSRDCLIMFDGLDEVADESDRRLVVKWLRTQISTYPGNKFVITSRPYGYGTNPLPNADRLEIQRFTRRQIEAFLHAWYETTERRSADDDGPATTRRAHKSASDLLEQIRLHASLTVFASNPLLLTMIALVHRYRGALPGTRAQLYDEMCSVLLHRRREAKGLTRERHELRGEQKERVARCLARHMMEHARREISGDIAAKVIGPVLTRMTPSTTAADYLREAVQSGLLSEPREQVFVFAHLTLQEFLAAAAFRESGDGEALLQHVENQWWRETILLWSSGSDVSQLVARCREIGTKQASLLGLEAIELGREIATHIKEAFLDTTANRATILRLRLARWLDTAVPLSNGTELTPPISVKDLHMAVRTPGNRIGSAPLSNSPELAVPWGVAMRLPVLARRVGGTRSSRLPTAVELEDPDAPDYGPHAVWVDEGFGPQLWCPPDVPDPFWVPPAALRDLLASDLGDEHPYLDALPVRATQGRPIEVLRRMLLDARRQLKLTPADAVPDTIEKLRSIVSLARLNTIGFGSDVGRAARVQALAGLATAKEQGLESRLRAFYRVALCTLAVHELRSTGVIQPNEILVLARD